MSQAIINCLERSEGNIWHTLAEYALAGKYLATTHCLISMDMPAFPCDEWDYLIDSGLFNACYEGTPEEQCLFLLFCGESCERT